MTTHKERPPAEAEGRQDQPGGRSGHSLPAGADSGPLTRKERDDLQKIARLNARVARAQIAAKSAELLAQFEAELAAKYPPNDPRWSEIRAEADAGLAALDGELAAICEAHGIRSEFRPSLNLYWMSRGENGVAERRAELRRVARSELEAAGKSAKSAIDAGEAHVLTAIISDGLTSASARDWLERIPSPDQLMQPITVASLEARPADRGRASGARLHALDGGL